MAARAGFAGRTIGLRPQLLALLHGEKSRIIEIVVLDRLGLLGAEPVSGDDLRQRKILLRRLDAMPLPMRVLEPALAERDAGSAGRDRQHHDPAEGQSQST